MSRCFPFPPPGYVLNGIRDEALIESIKRAEEKAKKEQRRKDRKSEKKDKKDHKEKKDKKENKEKKDKKRKEREGESEKHSHKRRRKEEEVAISGKNNQKLESENVCLERSSLTVERDLLQSTSPNSCDSTLNSNDLPNQHKEKQQPHNNNDSESIIRIRLPIRRQNDPEVVMMTTTNKDQQKPCPSREIKLEDTVKSVPREQPQQHPCSTSKPHEEKRKDQIFTTKLGKEKKLSSTSDPSSGLCRFCPPSFAVQFLNVVENWVPNTIERRVEELTNSEDDECWWFLKKPSIHKFDETERCKQLYRNNESKQVISSSMGWPCARLLPEADVLALPYTVPF